MNPCTTRMSDLLSSRVRRVVSVTAILAITLMSVAPDAFAQSAPQGPKKPKAAFNVIPISITGVAVVNGELVASGAVGVNPFTAPLTLTPLTPGACPVLDLSLGPIHLAVLGLIVDTSAICLKITAHSGQGLLGDLLCQIGTGLNQGISLSDVLAGLTESQLTTLTTALTSMLNQVFTQLTSSSALAGATCSVLNLSLGPVNLNLLGLQVHLDNCANGPITLDITADPAGGVLGELLCGLSNLLSDPNATLTAILGVLQQIAALLGQLVA